MIEEEKKDYDGDQKSSEEKKKGDSKSAEKVKDNSE